MENDYIPFWRNRSTNCKFGCCFVHLNKINYAIPFDIKFKSNNEYVNLELFQHSFRYGTFHIASLFFQVQIILPFYSVHLEDIKNNNNNHDNNRRINAKIMIRVICTHGMNEIDVFIHSAI